MTKRSIYRNTSYCDGWSRGDSRAESIAAAMLAEYGYLPSAVYVRPDGTIHVNSDGWTGDYENLRDLACFASYEADQSGANEAECAAIFARFAGAWEAL